MRISDLSIINLFVIILKSKKSMKTFQLNDGNEIPALGFGTWKLTGDKCTEAVKNALEIGYRHIDTADMYGNHSEVNKGIKESGIAREEIFLTTKIPPHDLSPDSVKNNCKHYLQELGVEYIDLFLIHWPNNKYPIGETLKAMEELKKEGLIISFGVSNFTIHHLRDAQEAGFEVVNNQVEMHVGFAQKELREYCNSNKIIMTAYSPLARGEGLDNNILVEIAKAHNATPAQIALAWINASGVVAIPKSADKARIKENFESQNITLSKEEIEKIDSIPEGGRMVAAGWNEFDY